MEFAHEISNVEKEFLEYDLSCTWNVTFQRLKNEASILSHDCSTAIARAPENRPRNRYRDVSPYDHSRVSLQSSDNDYINASLIELSETSNRRYILTQGPLGNTAGQFWLMIWQQRTPIIVMLNRLIEKGVPKCFPYYPAGLMHEDVDEKIFEEVDMKVTYLSEDNMGFYLKRYFLLENMQTGETIPVFHFHYLTWPDFGVPQSTGAFLNFLWAVREAAGLHPHNSSSVSSSGNASPTLNEPDSEEEVGRSSSDHPDFLVQSTPPVIHCSAGIGRSGTFILVDTCLLMISRSESFNGVDVKGLLLQMRRDRMGLIQTAEQLRFSYLAIIEGGRLLLNTPAQFRYQLQFPMSPEELLPPPNDDKFTEDSSSCSDEDELIVVDTEESDEEQVDDVQAVHSNQDIDDTNYLLITEQKKTVEEPLEKTIRTPSQFAEGILNKDTSDIRLDDIEVRETASPESQPDDSEKYGEKMENEVEILPDDVVDGFDEANEITEARRLVRKERQARTQAQLERIREKMRQRGIVRNRAWIRWALWGGAVAIVLVAGVYTASWRRI